MLQVKGTCSTKFFIFLKHFIAKFFNHQVNSNGRRIADASLRMRPYFIPERSRTKSENSIQSEAYSNATNYPCTNSSNGSNFKTVDVINSNSNSMMETCDAYLNSDCSGPSSSSNFPNSHILNSNQYFKPIKTHSLTSQIKKSRSLENIRVENIDGSIYGSQLHGFMRNLSFMDT